MAAEIKEVLPDASRLVEGLRDTGYQFNTAVADVVDNSVAAEAKHIDIFLPMDPMGRVTLKIFDDGIGMDREGLVDAMRYGAKRRPSPSSLGKFGLGLKTASTAFCRKLSVISRKDASAPLFKATWDLDRIASEGKWNLVIDDASLGEVKEFEKQIPGGVGTYVIWSEVDRLHKSYKQTGGAAARKAINAIVTKLRDHLSMVYQRFLEPVDGRSHTIEMTLDGENVEAWDPFCEGVSTLGAEKKIVAEMPEGGEAEFQIRAFILPRKEQFENAEAASNARISNANQGIYVYRENRLIHGPTWLGIRSKEPHFSLLRVEFSFDHRLDEAFQIDIKKSQILLDETLNEVITDFLNPVIRAAEDLYRRGSRDKTNKTAAGAHDDSNRNIASKQGQINQAQIKGTDPKTGETSITNSKGTVRLKLSISTAEKPFEIFVKAVPEIEDGLLWQPALIQDEEGVTHNGVEVNTGHPYYAKVYVPNLSAGVTVQGMDALLWGLCIAELNSVTDATKSTFEDVRFGVSQNLRKLVRDLPDPSVE